MHLRWCELFADVAAADAAAGVAVEDEDDESVLLPYAIIEEAADDVRFVDDQMFLLSSKLAKLFLLLH